MIRWLPSFLLFFSYVQLMAQKAVFYADTVSLHRYAGSTKEVERAMEMQWLINGKQLKFGSGKVEIIPNKEKFDIILYKQFAKSKWDTILCNIRQAWKYSFVFNPCCGGFNLKNNTTDKFPKGRVYFTQENKPSNYYLARLGETGILMHQAGNDTIEPQCRSAMSPNIYWIMFQEIEPCEDSTGCDTDELLCLYSVSQDPDYNLTYKLNATLLKFLYMPLDDRVLRIQFNEVEKSFEIK